MNYFLARKNFYKIVFASVFIVVAIFTVPAQDEITLSRSSVVSMITIYPGDRIYSVFGHSAFRVYDPVNDIDWMYNYGTFNFSDDHFVLKFIEGRLDYYLSIGSFERALRFYYLVERRKVFEQVLDFDLKQRQALFEFLEENGRPENRVYRYDFIWDNCATRITDAIDRVFPGLVDYSAYKAPEKSFRKMLIPYLGENPFTNFGIQLVLGRVTDRIPIGHEIFFLPLYMKEAFSEAVMKTDGSGTTPLVIRESVLADPGRIFNKKPDYPLFIFLSILIIYFASLVFQYRKNRGNKNFAISKISGIVSTLCEGFIFLFTGIIGLLITYLWFFSHHSVTGSNFNYLWCTPLSLILFVGIFLKKKTSVRKMFLFASNLSLIMCAAYLICIAAGAQYALPSFFPIVIFLTIAALRKIYITCQEGNCPIYAALVVRRKSTGGSAKK
ncbi:MAG: DUF4105 domain-containing protein [Spirochaetaceae bacterium]|nr:DUF4105 domain-containing protein [Spirochaetaceae bacterium]